MREIEDFRERPVKEIRNGVYELEGSGTEKYRVRAYRNAGTWGGHIIETDDGTRIQINKGSLADAVKILEKAANYKTNQTIGGTKIIGETGGVVLDDTKDSIKISDDEARRCAAALERYGIRRKAIEDAIEDV